MTTIESKRIDAIFAWEDAVMACFANPNPSPALVEDRFAKYLLILEHDQIKGIEGARP